ncbi:YlmH family RNA-binding protein [Paenibacillus senegalensis]|uniref:YlmH family RNA-binding protein n=1 Tax=Paenibacillus senegalensis TaxID=1465766 RepID=UPI000289106B|nr:YlmH/Sll1252 family protein [Paenibacillus senegalensis]
MTKEWFHHFHKDEHPFVNKAWEWIEKAEHRHEVRLTDFLDPRQAYVVSTLVNRTTQVKLHLSGGSDEAERKRAWIAPDYLHPAETDFSMCVLAVDAGEEGRALDHGDYMGAVLGLGLKRDKIGDIHVQESGCHYVIAQEVGDYLNLHLRQVHRIHVHTELLPLSELKPTTSKLEEMSFTVASLRLDALVGDVFKMSRAKALQPIKAGHCKVNWKEEPDPSTLLETGDLVSLKGYGRFKVMETEGMTKKGRIRIKIGRYC